MAAAEVVPRGARVVRLARTAGLWTGVLCTFGLLPWLGCGASTHPSLGLAVDCEEHDFGERHQGQELAHTFLLRNQGATSIQIIRVMSSCRCLAVGEDGRAPDTTIPPFGELPVPVRFTTHSAQGLTAGRLNVFYRLESESAESPPQRFVSLQVRADVIPDYRITPRAIDFGEIDGLSAQHVVRTVRVVPEGSKRVTVRQVRTASPLLTCRLLPRSVDDPGYEIEVSVELSGFVGSRSFDGTLVLSTDSKVLPEAVVAVHGRYLAPAAIEPPTVVIGSDEEREVTRYLRVSTHRPSTIRSVTSRTSAICAEYDGQKPSQEHRIRLVVAPCSQQALNDEMRIELDLFPAGGSSLVRTLSVPVHRFLRERE